MQIDAEVRLDESVNVGNRDVIVVFGYRSDTEYHHVRLSQDNTIYPHNGIFVVNNADRLRIDDQWTGTVGAPPAVTDAATGPPSEPQSPGRGLPQIPGRLKASF